MRDLSLSMTEGETGGKRVCRSTFELAERGLRNINMSIRPFISLGNLVLGYLVLSAFVCCIWGVGVGGDESNNPDTRYSRSAPSSRAHSK